jgi:hypothetical protein
MEGRGEERCGGGWRMEGEVEGEGEKWHTSKV